MNINKHPHLVSCQSLTVQQVVEQQLPGNPACPRAGLGHPQALAANQTPKLQLSII
jgi:hypothetical protein